MLKLLSQLTLNTSVTWILVLFVAAVGSHAQKRQLSKDEAIRLAEQFIAVNGYTNLPPDKRKFAYETIEWESNIDDILKERHDRLEQKAYGVLRGRKRGSAGWTVVFRYKHPTEQEEGKIGRAVTMNLDGSDTRVEHVDFILRFVEEKL